MIDAGDEPAFFLCVFGGRANGGIGGVGIKKENVRRADAFRRRRKIYELA